MSRTNAEMEIDSRIESINTEIDEQHEYVEYAASKDWQYRMAEARIETLVAEKNRLKEIRGDLA